MAEIRKAKYTTPDGVERDLRFTQAAQFRIAMEKERQGGAPPYFVLWAMLFDEDDNPPAFVDGPRAGQTLTAGWLGANLAPLDRTRIMAAISEATTGAALEKKIVEEMERRALEETQRLAGQISGLSLESVSDSKEAPPVQADSAVSSGGSRRKSSRRSVNGSPNANESPLSVLA